MKMCAQRKAGRTRMIPLPKWFKSNWKCTHNVTFKWNSKHKRNVTCARWLWEVQIKSNQINIHIQTSWHQCLVSEYHSGLKTASFCRTAKARTDHRYQHVADVVTRVCSVMFPKSVTLSVAQFLRCTLCCQFGMLRHYPPVTHILQKFKNIWLFALHSIFFIIIHKYKSY